MPANLCNINIFKNYFRMGKKISGNLPNDVMRLITGNNRSTKEAVTGIQNAFEDAASALKDINKIERQAINRLPHASGETQRRVEELLYEGDVTTLWTKDSLYVNASTEAIIKAEEKLLNGLKQYLPQTENVIISPLGSGQFANGYKCEIFDRNHKKMFSDKAIKVYRDQNLFCSLAEKNKRFAESASDNVLLDIQKKEAERMKKEFGVVFGYKRSADEIIQIANDTLKHSQDFFEACQLKHGAFAEARISKYIQYFTGHKIKPQDGLAIPYMFGLGDTKFCISEFIDKTIKAKKHFNFLRLGLRHTDFNGVTSKNNINGICYDVGGIESMLTSAEFATDKSVIRFIKKLFNYKPEKRREMIKEFESEFGEKVFSDKFIRKVSEK